MCIKSSWVNRRNGRNNRIHKESQNQRFSGAGAKEQGKRLSFNSWSFIRHADVYK